MHFEAICQLETFAKYHIFLAYLTKRHPCSEIEQRCMILLKIVGFIASILGCAAELGW